jgi:hypothetical protein
MFRARLSTVQLEELLVIGKKILFALLSLLAPKKVTKKRHP